jgi:predicted nucleic acid-binding Zn ribbon protein
MKRTDSKHISELLQGFYDANPELRQKLMEMRIVRAWGEVLGQSTLQATQNLYVKNGVLYVSVNSSVLRNELWLNRERLKKCLNDHAGMEVISDLIIR